MKEHAVTEVMETTLDKIKSMVDVNTIIGDAIIATDGTIVIPVSKVSFGFFSGGGEYENPKQSKKKPDDVKDAAMPFAGGAGAGISLQPIGFIVAKNDNVTMLPVNYNSSIERLVETLPTTVNQIKQIFSKNKSN